MIVWLDAHLSPALAPWMQQELGVETYSLSFLGLADATDQQVFLAAGFDNAVLMTKDSDFLTLLERHGPPPKVLWVTVGNSTNAHMREVLRHTLLPGLELLAAGTPMVEISDRSP